MATSGSSGQRPELLALGQAVRRRRERKGWTLDVLARESGVSRGMIVAIEGGRRNPGVVSVIDIAGALGVEASVLLSEAAVADET